MSKVKFNIKNVHYAKRIVGVAGAITYDTPVAIPGAVSITLDQQGDLTPFWADGIKYYVASSNGGYQGDLNVAMIPDKFREDILSEEKDTKNVLFENANSQSVEFALGFQIDGDSESTFLWFYNCTVTRPSVTANTTTDTKEPDTDTLTVSCVANPDGTVRAKTTASTDEAVKTAWFNTVYQKASGV